jgi:hypothetical protein
MNNLKDNSNPESINDFNFEDDSPKSHIWGIFYVFLGLGGLTFTVFSLWHVMKELTPGYDIMSSLMAGTLSQLVLVYGYSIMRRNV